MKKLFTISAMLVFVIALLAGCGTAKTTAAVTAKVPVKTADYTSKTATPFTVDAGNGKVTYLKSDAPEVVAVEKMMKAFSNAQDTIDYQHYVPNAEYGFYTPAYVAKLKAEKDEQQGIVFVGINKLKETVMRDEFQSIAFNKTMDKATVNYKDFVRTDSATPNFLTQFKTKIGETDPLASKVQLLKQNGQWKVDNQTVQ